MKNQYFGDENDYRKYGLLRVLTNGGTIPTTVCWMLTPNDGGSDGGLTEYLRDPRSWRHHDDELFDRLHELMHGKAVRAVSLFERSGLLPNAAFFSRALKDDPTQRRFYFRELNEIAAHTKLTFFDPDTGMEIKSVGLGRKKSNKYLFWQELEEHYRAGNSTLVYQHFPHENREKFIERRTAEFLRRTGTPVVFSFRTSRVVFFLISQSSDVEHYVQQSELLSKTWGEQFDIGVYE